MMNSVASASLFLSRCPRAGRHRASIVPRYDVCLGVEEDGIRLPLLPRPQSCSPKASILSSLGAPIVNKDVVGHQMDSSNIHPWQNAELPSDDEQYNDLS
jgi:hypothetical protein